MPRFKAQHCIFSNSGVDNFLGNFSETSLDAYFKLTSDFSQISKVEKSVTQTMVQNTGKYDFSVLFQQL